MEKFFIRWAANALGLFLAARLPSALALQFHDGLTEFIPSQILPLWAVIIIAGLILALVNTFIRPIVMLFTCLVNILTMGLFSIVINIAMIFVTSWLMENFFAAGFVPLNPAGIIAAVVAAVIIGIVNAIFHKVF